MKASTGDLTRRLAEAEATIAALLSGQIDAVIDSKSKRPVLLAEAQEALRASEERYRGIVETASEGIWTIDTKNRITFVNQKIAEMLGYRIEEMPRVPVSQFLPETAEANAAHKLRVEHTTQGLSEESEIRMRRKDGSSLWVLLSTSPIRNAKGNYAGMLAMVTDRTRAKESEEALRKSQEQLMVSDQMASIGTLAAGVAHEINNPLAAVISNLDYVLEVLRSTEGSPSRIPSDAEWVHKELVAPLQEANEAALRVKVIVSDLKIFSRAPTVEPKCPVDVVAVLESSLRMAWNEIRHRARLVKQYSPVPAVEVNEARLGQVFLNLIVNAAQALQEGRSEHNEIRVSTHQEGERVVIQVSDTGAGIPPEIIGRIFDAFFTTKEVGVGTGLGLAICRRIVADMNGEITVASTLGTGTTFRVALPVARLVPEEAVAAVAKRPVAVRRGRILVVDDEELVARGVQRILRHEHDVVILLAAKEALARCVAGERFDLILCDLMMPDMTGTDLHRELSRVAPAQSNRMIFMTAGAFTLKAQTFLSESPRYIEKPLDVEVFRKLVNDFLHTHFMGQPSAGG